MSKLHYVLSLFLCFSFSLMASNTHRADYHAPIGVMGDHFHKAGDWMMSYRVMSMPMTSLRSGKDSIKDSEVSSMMIPLDMTMTMHMIGTMYGFSENITLMGMLPVLNNSMSMKKKMGTQGSIGSRISGLGDLKLGALVKIMDTDTFKSHYGLMFALPTGSINESSNNSTVGYNMQPGSGTVDIYPSITFRWFKPKYSIGSQSTAIIRTGKNKKGYTLGQSISSTVWVAKPLTQTISISSRLTAQYDSGISGSHDDIKNPNMSVVLNSENSGGKRAFFGIGINTIIPSINHMYLSIEYNVPIYENLIGIQFESDSVLTAGTTVSF